MTDTPTTPDRDVPAVDESTADVTSVVADTPAEQPAAEPEMVTSAPITEPEGVAGDTETPAAADAGAGVEPEQEPAAAEAAFEADAAAVEPAAEAPATAGPVEAGPLAAEELPAANATPATAADADSTAEASPAAIPAPSAPKPGPRPGMPSPAMFAAKPKPAAAPAHPHSDSVRFGRVDADGTVYVVDGEGERAVGSYPGASNDEALNYFARKYDELFAAGELLHQRVAVPEVTAKDVAEGLKGLRKHIGDANVVGDLAALNALVSTIEGELISKRQAEGEARAAAKAEAQTAREALVASAEEIAAVPVERVQWKTASATMRSLLDTWKEHQRSGVRLDKEIEAALWQRFSKARNSFDKARRSHFAELESTRAGARATKEKLVAEAQHLATSTDWAATAGAFKRLMDQWRVAGRASRAEDDSLWEQFKSAQDSFFNAKDAVVAAEDEEYRANLEVKLALLADAEKLLPVTDLEAAKAGLRVIQDKWDKAGKVPRADIDRTEKGLRRIEATIRDAEDRKWRRSNPEVASRAHSLATQLEASVAKLESDLAAAEAKGNAKQVADLTAKLTAQRAWLDQARGGLAEFGG